jgi:radical SAM superfamily enzyme YgiQ (UPF0313 family)
MKAAWKKSKEDKMDILLVNPGSSFLINEKVFPSLGLLYLSAYLKKNGYNNISLIDMNDEKPLPETLRADVVGIYSNTPQYPVAVGLLKEIRARNRAKNPVYVFGGPHISGRPEDGLAEADIVVVGEGERAFLDIVTLKESSGAHERMLKYDYVKDIDELPFPDRELIDIKSYKYHIDGELTTTVISSRGCPFGCNFCANNAWGKSLRMRSPENVYEEVKMLKEKYGYKAFMFFDDTMTVDKGRMARICGLLKGLDIIYRCFIRSDTVDAEILRKMRGSGCVEVGIGVESGSQRILNIVNKGEKVGKNMEAIKSCQKSGIRVKGFIIIGLPGEDRHSVKETVGFLEEAGLDDIDVSVYTPYPGSLIYKNKADFDIDFKDDYEHAWYKGKPGTYTTTISTKNLSSSEILDIRNEIEKRFKKKPVAI